MNRTDAKGKPSLSPVQARCTCGSSQSDIIFARVTFEGERAARQATASSSAACEPGPTRGSTSATSFSTPCTASGAASAALLPLLLPSPFSLLKAPCSSISAQQEATTTGSQAVWQGLLFHQRCYLLPAGMQCHAACRKMTTMSEGRHGNSLCWQHGAMAQDPDIEADQLSHPGRFLLRRRLLLQSAVLLGVLLLHALLLLPVVLLAVLPLMR